MVCHRKAGPPAGFVISVVASAILEHLFSPDVGNLIYKLRAGVPIDQQAVIVQRLYHSANITVFVVNPLVGVVVGAFVGLLQRTRAMTLAVCCLIPDLIIGVIDDTRKVWAHSSKGIAIYAVHHALPFVAAAITAGAVRYLLALRRARIEGAARA